MTSTPYGWGCIYFIITYNNVLVLISVRQLFFDDPTLYSSEKQKMYKQSQCVNNATNIAISLDINKTLMRCTFRRTKRP